MTVRIRTEHGTLFPLKVGRLSEVERIITGRVTVRIDSKGYPVFKSGVYRDRRVHSEDNEEGRPLRRPIFCSGATPCLLFRFTLDSTTQPLAHAA
jgi:hypothetical protein